jgi:hypothetical protein
MTYPYFCLQPRSLKIDIEARIIGGLPFAKMSAQIAAIYVCICTLCAESAPNFQLEIFKLNASIYAAKMQT